MEQSKRMRQIGRTVREIAATVLLTSSKNPILKEANITDVEMTRDLKNAKVFFSALDESKVEALHKALARSAGFIQHEVAAQGQLKYTPVLEFVYDDTALKGSRIEKLIHDSNAADAAAFEKLCIEDKIAKRLGDAETILVFGHARPDGDSTGSTLALAHILRTMGKEVLAYFPNGIPEYLKFLPGSDEVVAQIPTGYKADVTVMLDISSPELMPTELPEKENRGFEIVIDHHKTDNDFGNLTFRKQISSTGEMIYQLSSKVMWPIDADSAMGLYAAIVSDTGSFSYDNSKPPTFEVAARLVEAGAKPNVVASNLYDTNPLERQRLLGEVSQTLRIEAEGKLATMHCTKSMLDKCGAEQSHLEGLINLGRTVKGVEVAILVKETDDGAKVSFRSNTDFDVADIAATWGGGGHVKAAGATVKADVLTAKQQVVAKIIEQFSK